MKALCMILAILCAAPLAVRAAGEEKAVEHGAPVSAQPAFVKEEAPAVVKEEAPAVVKEEAPAVVKEEAPAVVKE